ncbi:MAG: phosphomannomutase/phosphoglucomutase [Candidatus Uhrbacteria bacterium]|nr:phosphomannomutase/phosphoglucomutase [Candidatus Uhrbacteria bacterium]
MRIPRNIFKAYDIRGIAGTEVTNQLALAVGKGFATLLQKENPGKRLKVAVGRDMRETSPDLQQALIDGLVQSGVDVFDIGLVSTPAFYFAVGHLGADGGITASASHNPAEYNGFKLVRSNAIPVGGDTGIDDIADVIENEVFTKLEPVGAIEKIEGIAGLAVEAEIEFAGTDPIKPFHVVIDTANGMGAQYFDELLKKVNFRVDKMYWEFDGTFPNHEADPFKEKNMVDLQERVVEVGADLGISADGDGDRIFFVDNLGKTVEPAIVRGILSRRVLTDYPGAAIGFDVRPGKITEDMIIEAGGKPVKTRVGHSLIKEKMREVNAVFGGESSGHFFYKFPVGTFEGPVVAVLHFLQELTRSGETLAEFIAPLKRYFHSGEINFDVEDKDGMIGEIKKTYQDGELNELDGITITYPKFWFNVRPSNTESKLRLNLEAVDAKTMQEKRDEITAIITGK